MMKPYIYLSVSYQSDGGLVRDIQQTLQEHGVEYKRHEGKEYNSKLLVQSSLAIFIPPMHSKRKVKTGVGGGQYQELELAKSCDIPSFFVCDRPGHGDLLTAKIEWSKIVVSLIVTEDRNVQNNHAYVQFLEAPQDYEFYNAGHFARHIAIQVMKCNVKGAILNRKLLLLI